MFEIWIAFILIDLKNATKKDPSHTLRMRKAMRGWWGRQWEKKMRKERKSRQCCGPKGSHHELHTCITATKTDEGVFKTKCGCLQNKISIFAL